MNPGFYVVEYLRRERERTVVEITDSDKFPVTWMGGDESSSLAELLNDFRIIDRLDIDELRQNYFLDDIRGNKL